MDFLKARKIISRAGFIAALILFAIFILIPIYWCIVMSFKPTAEILSKDVTYWPVEFTLQNYVDAWTASRFSVYFKNSMIIAVVSDVVIIIVAIVTGYCLARFKFKGKSIFMLLLLCSQFIPHAMLVTPMFLIFKNLGLLNNLFGLVLVNATFQIPFNSILMRGFVGGIDYSLEEAAHIDGCGKLAAIWHVTIPLLRPGIATVAAYGFVSCWNEFLFSFMFISKQGKLTLPIALKSMIGEYSINYGQLAAGAVIAVLPALLLFSFAQKYLVSGMTSGAVKG